MLHPCSLVDWLIDQGLNRTGNNETKQSGWLVGCGLKENAKQQQQQQTQIPQSNSPSLYRPILQGDHIVMI